MKALRWTLFLTLMIWSGAWAQITITAGDYDLGIGTTRTHYELSSFDGSGFSVNVGTTGGPQTWIFNESTYPGGESLSLDVLDPAATPFASEFPNANHSWFFGSDSADLYTFLEANSNGVYSQGFAAVTDSGNYVEPSVPAEQVFKFPASLNDTWNSVTVERFSVPGFEIVDSTVIDHTIDAWGTVELPAGSFPALRARLNETSYSLTIVNGTVIFADTTVSITYDFFTNQGPGFLGSVSSLNGETNPNFTTGEYLAFLTNIQTTGIENQGRVLASGFELSQNYPNPFNPTTTIQVRMSETAPATLAVHDLSGRVIATLQNGLLSSGEHNFTFDASGLSSGLYFYNLNVEGHSTTRRMVLVK